MSHYFVTATLLRLIADNWNAFTVDNRLELRQWLLGMIATRAPSMERHNVTSLILVLCRLTKLGWLDHPKHQELPKEVIEFFLPLESPPASKVIGLMILNTLITEVNTAAPKHTLAQHRKTSVSFRDTCLFDIFKTSIMMLQMIQANPQAVDAKVCEQALALALCSLTFDFVGIFPDESSDEVGTVQIPTTWRSVVLDQNTLQLFWNLYAALPAPRSTECLKCIVQFASMRRSLFVGDEERRAWLQHILSGILTILVKKQGLEESENYYEFCRLLSRIKPNYQLSELVGSDSYVQWVELSARFTVESFINWRATATSHFFLLALWSRLISSQPYLKGDKPSHLGAFVPEVAQAYVRSRLELAQAIVSDPDCVDDPLDNQEVLLNQLESIPVLARACYEKVGPFILSLFCPIMEQFQKGTSIQQIDQSVVDKFTILESQLTWLVYIMGSIVGHHITGNSSGDAEKMDGLLTARVFELSNAIQVRVQMPGALQSNCLQRLEKSILFFLQSFRKVHIGESSMPCSKVYPRLQELTGLQDHLQVLNFVVGKVVSNLKVWRSCQPMVSETLNLFCDLSSGYSSGRFLLKLDSVKFMLANHSGPDFPFLNDQINTRYRSKFYKTMANLLFMETVAESAFERFMMPLHQVCLQLEAVNQPEAFASVEVKRVVVGLMRDLRGICSSCANKRTYTLFFEWLFPAHMELMRRCCQVYGQDNDVAIVLLKFFADFVQNRSQRISFEPNSPNGILLFKEASTLLKMYGQTRLAMVGNIPENELYAKKYKGYYICMNVLARALGGNYCNFGAMSYYNDDALEQALNIVIEMALSIRISDLLGLSKVGSAYFQFMEILFSSHTQTLTGLETTRFLHIAHSLEEAIKSVELNRQSVCSAMAAIGHLMSYYFAQLQKGTEHAARLGQHFQQDPELFSRILNSIFTIVLFEECSNQWSMTRPMLPLILINPGFYEEYQRKLISSLAPEKQIKMQEAFNKLMDGVENNLETKNRDKFTQNVTTFRHQAKAVL